MVSELLLLEKGKEYFGKKDYSKAEVVFKKVLRIAPNDDQAHFELGKIYYVREKYLSAIEEFKKTIDLNQKSVFAHLLLSKCYKAQKMYYESIEEFKKVLKLGFQDENIHKELAELYRALGKFNLAATELSNALRMGYDDKEYRSDLDCIYRDQINLIQSYNFEGNYSRALKEAEGASRLIPDENPLYQNMLLNEMEISQKKISLASKVRGLTVTLTNKCNLACIMCKTRNIPWEVPQKTIKKIISLFPYLERIMWQGGEAFLFDGFKELLKEAGRFPMRQVIATNGLLIDEEIAEIMVKSNVELTFSVDGATKEVYEHIRRGAKFEKVIEKVNLINELRERLNPRMQTRLNVLIMQANYHQVEQFLEFAKKYKFNVLFFNSVGCDFKNFRENVFYYNQDKEVLRYINKVRLKITKKAQEYGVRLENWLPSFDFFNQDKVKATEIEGANPSRNDKLFCHAPWQRLYIDCGGKVRPDCLCLYDSYVGDVLESSLEEIWNGEKIREYRTRIVNQDYQNFCNPDCVWGRVPAKNLKFV